MILILVFHCLVKVVACSGSMCIEVRFLSVKLAADCFSPVPFVPILIEGQPMAIWVATTLDMIPTGSLIINPQTGKPHLTVITDR